MKENLKKLLRQNEISIDEDIFEYGWKILTNYFLFFLILIPFAIILDVVVESLLFIVIYTPLKRYIGGFHFNSKKLCITFSIITTLLIAILAKKIVIRNEFCIYFTFFILFLISTKIGATDHKNKRLTRLEKNIYTKYSLIIEGLYLGLIILFKNLNCNILLNLVFFSICFSVGGIVLAKLITNVTRLLKK